MKQAIMYKHIFFCCLSLLIMAIPSLSQTPDAGRPATPGNDDHELTSKEIAAINTIAKSHRTGAINLETIKKEIQGRSDLSAVSVRDALNRVMMKIQQNAEKDLQQADDDLKSANEKKDSIRKREYVVKKDRGDLQNKLQHEYDTLKAASTSSNARKSDYGDLLRQKKLSASQAENATQKKKNAADHLQSVKDAIKKSQQAN
jgi:hypothetical protein